MARRRNWISRMLEVSRLQAKVKDKRRWLDEMHRQMGERLEETAELPGEAEIRAWRNILAKSRRELELLQLRLQEVEHPSDEDPPSGDTRPRIIRGGAVLKSHESRMEAEQAAAAQAEAEEPEAQTEEAASRPTSSYTSYAEVAPHDEES